MMRPPRSFKKPYRVETWFERDRSSIVVYDAADHEIAEWWDDDVQDMFEGGFFTPGRGERALAESVLVYVAEMGLDMPAGLDRAAKMRRVAAKRQGKNPADPLPAGIRILNIQELLSTGMVTGTRIHFTLFPGHKMKTARDVEKIILAHFPGKSVVSNYSLRPEAYPGVKHAYGIFLKDKGGAKGYPMRSYKTFPSNPPFYEIRPGDVDKPAIKFLTRVWRVSDFIGRILPTDIGKRVFYINGILQVENDEQFKRRMKLATDFIERTRRSYEDNPPIPASALMDLTTARTITREVNSGERPLQDLTQAISLEEAALKKLRSSHEGQIDFSNPPATEIYRDVVEIRALKPNGKPYAHKFGRGSNIFGLPDGDILIRSRKGKRLWKNFEMEG